MICEANLRVAKVDLRVRNLIYKLKHYFSNQGTKEKSAVIFLQI
jgi:hypothetical protein